MCMDLTQGSNKYSIRKNTLYEYLFHRKYTYNIRINVEYLLWYASGELKMTWSWTGV